MKKKIFTTALLSACLLGSSTLLTSCDEETLAAFLTEMFNGNEYSSSSGDNYFGWFGLDEDTENIEDDINLSTTSNNNLSASLPSKVDLRNNLPTIGDQGQYGTCVAWATAYNCRTWLYAKAKGLTTSQLNTSNTFSPKDIFTAIDDRYKGEDCGGTNFEYAFDVMVSRGVANLSTVPYQNLGDCSKSNLNSSWASNAANYKIKSYREIKVDKNTIKQYLSEGRLVVFGAKLGDEFMYASGSTVLTTQTSFNYTGMHAYHAMVCAGYDDSKGSNGAFLVVNSWGKSWGDNGYIWVDENFFAGGDFAYCAFVAYGLDDEELDIDDSNSVVNTNSGYDLIPTHLSDEDYVNANDADADDPKWRTAYYDVYNAGESTISSSNNWAICYLWYNAYDANKYGIVLFDFYTNAYGEKGECDGKWNEEQAYNATGVSAQGYCWNNIDVKGGESVAHAVDGRSGTFKWTYQMPKELNGKYYLVMIADAFGAITESNEDNNYCFVSDEPISIINGVVQGTISKNASASKGSTAKPRQNESSPLQTVVTPQNPNTYSPQEISAMINAHRKSGDLAKKIQQWRDANGNSRLTKPRQ